MKISAILAVAAMAVGVIGQRTCQTDAQCARLCTPSNPPPGLNCANSRCVGRPGFQGTCSCVCRG